MTAPAASILIVDDEPQNCRLLEAMLHRDGYATVAVADGEAALAATTQRAPDLILLDIKLPGMDGYQVASALKNDPRTSNIPIIMVTALVDRDARMAALKSGAEELVTKPIDPSELSLRVRNLLRLKTFGDLLRDHGAILEQQVQERTAELRRSESLKGAILESSLDGIVTIDHEGKIVEFNPAAAATFGFTREQARGKSMVDLIVPPRLRDAHRRGFAHFLATGAGPILGKRLELEAIRADGTEFPIELAIVALAATSTPMFTGFIRDVTAPREAVSGIKRLNRVYAVLSGVNSAILRNVERDALFEEFCRIAVSEGGFIAARVVELDSKDTARIAASTEFGSQLFQKVVDDYNGNPEGSQNLLALALRSGQPLISNDVANDLRMPNRAALTTGGTFAVALLPIIVERRVTGMIVLRAREAGMFDEAEMRLLTELTSNIAFAIDHIDKQARLDYLAYYDALTGLANRSLFLERLSQHMRSAVGSGHRLALFFFDLERFRNINDSLGRPAGDALLMQVSEWLVRNVGEPNLLARLGGDTFAIMLPEVKPAGDVSRLLDKRIRAFLDHPFCVNDTEIRLAAKVGAALFPNDGTDADTLLRNAEAALKRAKARGDRILFYVQAMNEAVAGNLTMEGQLRQALENEEFVLHFQPKVNLGTGKLASAEALIRWNDPRTGLVPPGRFIPILEETGLIHEVGRWAMRKAIEQSLRWRAAGLPAMRVAVNVSPLQLRSPGFIAEVRQAISIDAHAAAVLEIEITESVIMEDVRLSIASLQAIRAMGITIAIDDFGTGFSSLSYLAKLPVDTLKIDRSFVVDMTSGPDGMALVSMIINLAHSLKLTVVAEGVETEEQSRLLRLLHCDQIQGYFFSKPVPVDEFEARFLALPVAA